MATECAITDGTVRALTATGAQAQPIQQALEVMKYDQADLILHIAGVEGAVSVFVVSIITGMTLESEDAWLEIDTFASTVTAGLAVRQNFTGLGKYIRWKVKTITGGTSVTFSVRGMLRNN